MLLTMAPVGAGNNVMFDLAMVLAQVVHCSSKRVAFKQLVIPVTDYNRCRIARYTLHPFQTLVDD